MRHLLKIICLLLLISNVSAIPRFAVISWFDAQDTIEPFLNDIINKNIFADIELFLISNQATDEQLQLINQYSFIFLNINCLHNQKATISNLCNQAIAQTQAPIVTYMGIDDYRSNELLEAQLKELEDNLTVDIVYSDYHISYSKNAPSEKADNWYLSNLPDYSPAQLYRHIPGPHTMWRASIHKHCGLFLDTFQFHYLWEFWNRCASKGVMFKKITGNPGTYYFNYFDQKKILNSCDDYKQSCNEETYIKDHYNNFWEMKKNNQKSFVIITASYNNKDWYRWNLDYSLNQNYENYRVIYIDDNSLDQTGTLVQEYAKEIGKENKIQVIINKKNVGALENIYNAIHSCKPDEIIVLVDGDDRLSNYDVLSYLNTVYQDSNVWLTYGQFEWFPAHIPGFVFQIPDWVIERNGIREYRWITTHLRTFYAGLFHKIKKEDLMYENKFYSKAWDLGIMYPMIEMAAWHTKFTDEILLYYNSANQINDNKVALELQGKIDSFIRGKERYKSLEKLF